MASSKARIYLSSFIFHRHILSHAYVTNPSYSASAPHNPKTHFLHLPPQKLFQHLTHENVSRRSQPHADTHSRAQKPREDVSHLLTILLPISRLPSQHCQQSAQLAPPPPTRRTPNRIYEYACDDTTVLVTPMFMGYSRNASSDRRCTALISTCSQTHHLQFPTKRSCKGPAIAG